MVVKQVHHLFFYKTSPHISRQSRPGVDKGPIHLVEAGLIDQITELGWKVDFDGHHQFEDQVQAKDDPPIGIVKNPRLVSRVTEAVADVVGRHARDGKLPITLGGDHSLVCVSFVLTLSCLPPPQAMGTISGTLRHVSSICKTIFP